MKPNIPPELMKVVDKLELPATLLLQGILLDHALKLVGMSSKPPAKPKSVIQL